MLTLVKSLVFTVFFSQVQFGPREKRRHIRKGKIFGMIIANISLIFVLNLRRC